MAVALINVSAQKCLGDSLYNFTLHDNNQLVVNSYHHSGTLYDTSSVFIVSGGYVGTLNTYNSSSANFFSGGDVSSLYAHSSSYVNFYGGSLSLLYAYDSSFVNVSSESVGGIGSIVTFNSSSANVSSGNVYYLYAYDSSFVNVSGGSLNTLRVHYSGSVNVSGGSVDYLYACDSGSIIFYGRNFGINGKLIPGGEQVLGTGTLTGEWMDGTQWMINILRNDPTAVVRVVPEPATLLLLGLGGLTVMRKR